MAVLARGIQPAVVTERDVLGTFMLAQRDAVGLRQSIVRRVHAAQSEVDGRIPGDRFHGYWPEQQVKQDAGKSQAHA